MKCGIPFADSPFTTCQLWSFACLPGRKPKPHCWPVVSPSLAQKMQKKIPSEPSGNTDPGISWENLTAFQNGCWRNIVLESNLSFQWKLSHQFPHFYSRNCLGWLCADGPGSGSDHSRFHPTSNPSHCLVHLRSEPLRLGLGSSKAERWRSLSGETSSYNLSLEVAIDHQGSNHLNTYH